MDYSSLFFYLRRLNKDFSELLILETQKESSRIVYKANFID